MESPRPAFGSVEPSLRSSDYLLLLLLCSVLYGFSLVQPRVLSTHETVHCLNVREMFASDNFLIPTYGGRPWLERPPAPHWLTGVFAAILGDFDREWIMRLGSITFATLAVLLFAGAVASCLGRTTGVMAGAVLATTREFSAYATGPEADIFLASTVTVIGSLCLRLLFQPAAPEGPCAFFGKRSLPMFLFFFLLGATNWMKGPLFGMIFVLLPLVGYWVWNRRLGEVRPFVWFWGWLIAAATGAAWPLIAFDRYPDIVELWLIDYGMRWKSGYIGEPFWYYPVNQPWNLFPWSLAAFIGMAATVRSIIRGESLPLRYLACWALLPLCFFSLFKGKHHHYMLSCLAPTAVFAAIGARSLWNWMLGWPRLLRQPWWWMLLLGLPGAVAIALFGGRFPGPGWVRWVLAFGWPVVVVLVSWLSCHRNGRLAFSGGCAVIVALNCFFYFHRSNYLDSYEGDRAFLDGVRTSATTDRPLLVICDKHPLTSSWLLYYLGERAQLLHNITFLRDDRLTSPEVFVICRHWEGPALAEYGAAKEILRSPQTRGEGSPEDRWALYSLRFHPHLTRMPGDVRITPLQATGRASGPFLGRSTAEGTASRGD